MEHEAHGQWERRSVFKPAKLRPGLPASIIFQLNNLLSICLFNSFIAPVIREQTTPPSKLKLNYAIHILNKLIKDAKAYITGKLHFINLTSVRIVSIVRGI